MDFRQMQYLVTLADEEQFTRAAAVCGVSQSGLSAAVRALEDELGTTLFDRTTRRVEPTAAGRALLPHARTMLAQAAAARDAVVRATRELSGSLRVGAEQCLGIVDVVSLARPGSPAIPAGRPGLHPGRLTRARQPRPGRSRRPRLHRDRGSSRRRHPNRARTPADDPAGSARSPARPREIARLGRAGPPGFRRLPGIVVDPLLE